MMKKLFRFLVMFVLCGMLLAVGGFLALTLYYRNNFPVNTWINGVYCTGKTVEQVNEELIGRQDAPSVIYVVDAGRSFWEIDMEEAGVTPDYTSALRAYLGENAVGDWLDNLHTPVSGRLAAGSYVAEGEKLRECFEALPFVAQEQARREGVLVVLSEEGYDITDGNTYRLNLDKAYACLEAALARGEVSVDLAASGCYENLPDTAADREQRELWNQICEFMGRCGMLAYDMGTETIALTPDIAARFLETDPGSGCPVLDGQGKIALSAAGVREWVGQLSALYDTCGTERAFHATRGDVVTVKYVTYGTKIDAEAEVAYLTEALGTDFTESQLHVPAYAQQGYVRGLDDIGGTYIEIDMTEQKMYYYVDGGLALETDVVTGNTGRRMGTPQGINFVYNKERNRTLRGPGYASFVKYWVPVKGAIGIHDASWRSSFGGTIYKTNGSHGCINTPSDVMAKLYDMVEIGTPVVMFY